jgi:hypothetical protein
MDPSERLNLQRMIKENDVEETTDLIRNVKHSNQIRENVKILEKLRNENPEMVINNPDDFDDMCIFHCGFLFNHYTDIYNKVKKNELDMDIFDNFLNVLSKIEDGKIDQHEGSFEIGKLLKKLYIDSALRKADKLDDEHKSEPKKESKTVSWREWKKRQI